MVKDIKQWLLGYLIGVYKADQIVKVIDRMILNEVWYDEFSNLSSATKYDSGNIFGILSSGTFELSKEDFEIFENRLLQIVRERVQSKQLDWKKASKYLFQFIKIKQQYFNFSSNELDDFWFGIINDNELRQDNLPSSITNSTGFLELLGTYKSGNYDYISDIFRLD